MPQRLLSGRGYRYVRSSTILCDVSNTNHAPAAVTPICALPKQIMSTSSLTRRCFLAGSMFGAHLLQTPTVIASELQDYISRAFPPPPEVVLFPRKTLNQPFAILLMRSAYETVDDLDFIPMVRTNRYGDILLLPRNVASWLVVGVLDPMSHEALGRKMPAHLAHLSCKTV